MVFRTPISDNVPRPLVISAKMIIPRVLYLSTTDGRETNVRVSRFALALVGDQISLLNVIRLAV